MTAHVLCSSVYGMLMNGTWPALSVKSYEKDIKLTGQNQEDKPHLSDVPFYKLSVFRYTAQNHLPSGVDSKGLWSERLEVLYSLYRKKRDRGVASSVQKMRVLKAIAEMHLENKALFWETVRENNKSEEDFNSLPLLEVVIVLIWSGDPFSILNPYVFSISINYPSGLDFKTSQNLPKAPKRDAVF